MEAPTLFVSPMARRHSRGRRSSGVNITHFSTQLNRLTISHNPFRHVPRSSYLLLLTPYLHVAPTSSSPGMDPFETLGRNLTQFHSNIRHVPYVAGQGLIDIHKQYIACAGGVIVVVCKPELSEVDEDKRLDDEDDQISFAEDASDLIEKANVPGLLVTVGISHGERIPFSGDHLGVDDWEELATAAQTVYQL